MDAACAGVCDSQELYLCACAVDRGCVAQGGQDVAELGLEYREEDVEGWWEVGVTSENLKIMAALVVDDGYAACNIVAGQDDGR